RDRSMTGRVEQVTAAYRELLDAVPAGVGPSEGLRDIRWMIEELRISLFAQALGTPRPISEQRIYRAMDDLPVSA
ncbi:MAG: DUF3418 domain-containing protein, partial [Frankia sp.]